MPRQARKESGTGICIRGHFEEFTDDAVIRDVLIEVRSEEEYQEMINCLMQEKEQQKASEDFAREMRTFYDRKTAKTVNKK